MNKTSLIDFLKQGVDDIVTYAQSVPADAFYFKPADNVWSAAENVQHLMQSVQPLNRLFGRPKSYFVEKWGQPKHASRSYEEIVNSYHEALNRITVATGAFSPLTPNENFVLLLDEFKQEHYVLLSQIAQWEEEEFDNYAIPHPLMGLLTVKEMLFFTAYHLRHHHRIMEIRSRLLPSQ